MDEIKKVKSISIWIFIIPFVAINLCLILITQFHELFPNSAHVLTGTIPYFDGRASISRTARVFPTYLIFKPAMFLTSYLLIKYWINNKIIMKNFSGEEKYIKKFVFFGIGSAINKKYTFKTAKKIFHEKTRLAIQKKSTEYAIYLILKELKKI